MTISIAIMAHPARKQQAELLFNQVRRYPFAGAQIVYDEDNTEWHTGKRALQAGIEHGDWHVVIQDDALLTPDFYENIENAIKALPVKTIFSLYCGTSRPFAKRVKTAVDKAQDGDFLQSNQLYWGVGIVLPTDQIEPMLEFVEDVDLQYDNKIGEFYCQNKLPVYYTMPSLVDHNDDTGTLIAGHGKQFNDEPRVAHKLATGLVDWTGKTTYI